MNTDDHADGGASASGTATVSAKVGLRLMVAGHAAVPLVANLHYSADDPFAIRMALDVGTDEPVEWTFARDLLASGLQERAGAGDVRIFPGGPYDYDVLNIALSSPSGRAQFEAPLSAMAAFLQRTLAIVAAGHEIESIDIDRQLRELIWPELPAQ
jgi:hypothetical protein